MRPVDFLKALGVAILIMVLDIACAFGVVWIFTLIYPPTHPIAPTDPLVIHLSTMSTRIIGPILFALFVWLVSRKRPDRNAWAFALAVFGFYVLVDTGTLFLLPDDPADNGQSKLAIMVQRGVLATMAIKLVGSLVGAALAARGRG